MNDEKPKKLSELLQEYTDMANGDYIILNKDVMNILIQYCKEEEKFHEDLHVMLNDIKGNIAQ